MWDIDNFLKEDSFHATSTLVGLLLIFWESPKEKFEILLKDFELLMVEEAKLVVDCPTVVDEPENYGPTLQCTGHQIVGCFSSSSFQLLWTKYWIGFFPQWNCWWQGRSRRMWLWLRHPMMMIFIWRRWWLSVEDEGCRDSVTSDHSFLSRQHFTLHWATPNTHQHSVLSNTKQHLTLSNTHSEQH